ncbi:MAG: hypothetical protein AAF503_14035, partial [Pseudomonadota bacterium]
FAVLAGWVMTRFGLPVPGRRFERGDELLAEARALPRWDAYTGTGTVVTRDVPAGDLAIARVRQENKAGFGKALRERLAAKKNKQR